MSTFVKSLKQVSKQLRRGYVRLSNLSRFQQISRLGRRSIFTNIRHNRFNCYNDCNKFNKFNKFGVTKNVSSNIYQSCNMSPSLIYFNQMYITTANGAKRGPFFQSRLLPSLSRGFPGGPIKPQPNPPRDPPDLDIGPPNNNNNNNNNNHAQIQPPPPPPPNNNNNNNNQGGGNNNQGGGGGAKKGGGEKPSKK